MEGGRQFLTAAVLVGVIRAVVDTVTFGIHLVDTFIVLAHKAVVRAHARSYSGVERDPTIKTHNIFESQLHRIVKSKQSNAVQSVRPECTMHSD